MHALLGLVVVTALAADPVEYVKLEIVGTLDTGVKAPGGETTGFVVRASGVSYELDFGKNHELRQKAEKWNKQRIVVTGELSLRRGQQGPRTLVLVSSLSAVEP